MATDAPPPLIVKYRPRLVSEFCAPPALGASIGALMRLENISIMFVGGGFSGKTILLDAVAREYYGIPRAFAVANPNILFANSLGEHGIGFYRTEMKTFCKSRSTISGKKKMIIIDDMDALTEQSQHVFRNYIDKYGKNVHFVAACANPQKVVESIRSRLHEVRIPAPASAQIDDLIARVVAAEEIRIDAEAVRFMRGFCGNSICAVLNYLEKVRILDVRVSAAQPVPARALDVLELITDIPISDFERYFALVRARQMARAIEVLYAMHEHGYSVIDILEYLFAFAKASDLLGEDEKYTVVEVLCRYIAIFNTVHEDAVELALMTNNMVAALGAGPLAAPK